MVGLVALRGLCPTLSLLFLGPGASVLLVHRWGDDAKIGGRLWQISMFAFTKLDDLYVLS